MTDVSVTQQVIEVVITPEDGPAITLTTTAPAEVLVNPLGMQGPPGPSGDTFGIEAGEPISALRVVSQANGAAFLCNPSSLPSVASIIGVAITASAMAATVQVRRIGALQDASWAWVVGLPVFCAAAGVLTQVAPSTVASRHIGIATSPTEILIELSETLVLE